MRHIFSQARWKDSIRYSLVLDGAGSDTIVAEALGNPPLRNHRARPRRTFLGAILSGIPNPILVLARAIESFSQTSVPSSPKTTFNVGVIVGRHFSELHSLVGQHEGRHSLHLDGGDGEAGGFLAAGTGSCSRRRIAGERAAYLVAKAIVRPQLRSRAHRKSSGWGTRRQRSHAESNSRGGCPSRQRGPNSTASTDANIPLSLGREAIAIGARRRRGCHTLQERFDCTGRELGLKRILLAYGRWPEWAKLRKPQIPGHGFARITRI